MQHIKLGRTGLDVSRLCLGCMSYGEPDRGAHTWTLGEAASRPFLKKALDLGINFFDTANVYSAGSSEEIVGRALLEYARRGEVVLATKVNGRMHKGPNGAGLSRKAIFAAIDASLKRLGTDFVDLYQIHRWDPTVPIEETLEALNDVVRAGKAVHIGASSMFAWQFAKMLYAADANGWTRFVTMQNHFNLLYREEEREMIPLCLEEGIGVLPWSPLARGLLAGKRRAKTTRAETDTYGHKLYGEELGDADARVIESLEALANESGMPPAQMALAWLLQKPGVIAPIIGVSRPPQLADALAALDVQLASETISKLEEAYAPHPVAGI